NAAAPVDAHGTPAMGTGRDAPVIGRDQIRRPERAPAVARGAQHHVANVPREDLAPDPRHRFSWTAGRVQPAAHAGVVADLGHALHLRATLDDAGHVGAGIGPTLAAVEPRHEHAAFPRHGAG